MAAGSEAPREEGLGFRGRVRRDGLVGD
uniref:Uncharacterized protein n=1 Tax=Arundo donax TaxID=35708 RepID=A0A0A9BKY5_ARUDO